MLDICFNVSVAGNLMMARNLLNTDGVLPLNLHLNYGKLSGDVIATQERLYFENLFCSYSNVTDEEIEGYYTEGLQHALQCLKDLEERLKSKEPFRVWVSHTAHDLCNLYWLCHFARSYRPGIFVVICPGFELDIDENRYVEASDWAGFNNHRFMAECSKHAIKLSQAEIAENARTWAKLVKKDAPLRVLVDGSLLSTTADFFDPMILQHIGKKPKSQSLVLGDFLCEHRGMDVNFVCSRIEYLLKSNAIKVCEHKIDSDGCCWQRTLSKV